MNKFKENYKLKIDNNISNNDSENKTDTDLKNKTDLSEEKVELNLEEMQEYMKNLKEEMLDALVEDINQLNKMLVPNKKITRFSNEADKKTEKRKEIITEFTNNFNEEKIKNMIEEKFKTMYDGMIELIKNPDSDSEKQKYIKILTDANLEIQNDLKSKHDSLMSKLESEKLI